MSLSTIHHPQSIIPAPRHHPPYSIRKHVSFWSLTFNGQEACFEHERGAYYVAYLLLNPPPEPVHGMALALRANAWEEDEPGETYMVHPVSGEVLTIPCDATLSQRCLCLDDAEALASLRRKQLQLEAILAEENESEPAKAEVIRELEAIYKFQKNPPCETLSAARQVVRAVRKAIQRFHQSMASAVDPKGNPHAVLRPFAAHLEKHLLIPTSRYWKAGRPRTSDLGAGTFTYEPPEGVEWTR
jgi:hypothetical protein